MSPGFKGRLPSAGRLAVIYIKYLYRMNQGTTRLTVGWVWSTRTHQVREASACRPSAPTLPETRMRRPSTPRDKDAAILFKRSTCAMCYLLLRSRGNRRGGAQRLAQVLRLASVQSPLTRLRALPAAPREAPPPATHSGCPSPCRTCEVHGTRRCFGDCHVDTHLRRPRGATLSAGPCGGRRGPGALPVRWDLPGNRPQGGGARW